MLPHQTGVALSRTIAAARIKKMYDVLHIISIPLLNSS